MSVVQLRDREAGTESGKRIRLLVRCRDLAAERLGAALKPMLDKVDDALFELAEKSENNALQRTYFDAMREVRLKRAGIEAGYRDEFVAVFDYAVSGERPQVAAAIDFEHMSLVDEDAVEEEIAVANMAAKIASQARDDLYALDKRIGSLMGRPDLDGNDNPLSPKAVCNAMRQACSRVDAGIEVRLIMLKLFDRYVVDLVPAVYREINQYFVEHRVLPEIRAGVRRFPASQAASVLSQRGTFSAGAGEAGEDGLLGMLRALVGAGGADGFARMPAAGIGVPGVSGAVTALTGLQHGNVDALAAAGGFEVEAVRAGRVNVLRALRGSGLLADLQAPQHMTVDIVAMLFDYVLADGALPDAMKALIGRLQIPMVKVALLDGTFFSKKSHPARRLLNTIAEAAARVREEPAGQAALHAQVETLVARVVAEFEDDVGVFAAITADFERFVAEGLHEAVVRRERSARVVQGRERLEQAKIFARNAVERCVAKHGHVELVYNFLLNHWKTLIITSHVECGEDSAPVAEALRVMDDLAWSVTPKTTVADRDRLHALLPGLIKRLQRGMESVSAPPAARARFLDKLAQCHAEAVRRVVAQTAASTPPADEECERTLPEGTTAGDLADEAAVTVDPFADTLPEGTTNAMLEGEGGQADPGAATGDDGAPCTQPIASPAAGDTLDTQPAAHAVATGVREPAAHTRSHPPHAQDPDAAPAHAPAVPVISGRPPDGAAASEAADAVDFAGLFRDRLARDGAVCLADVLAVATGAENPARPPQALFDLPVPAATDAADGLPAMDVSALFRLGTVGSSELERLLAEGAIDVEDVTLGEIDDGDGADGGDDYTRLVATLAPGTWLEFDDEHGNPVRAQLAWINGVTDLFVFTDKQGRKLNDRTRNGLTADLRRGTARVVEPDSPPLFERAFGRLLDGLGGSDA